MEVAVGFGWETGLYSSAVLSLGEVFLYHLFYETQTAFLAIRVLCCCCHNIVVLLKCYCNKVQRYD